MSEYATLQDVKFIGIMPSEDVDELELRYPAIVQKFSTMVSNRFDSMLVKRYAVPFETPYPPAIVTAVCHVVAYWLFLKRGFNPSSQQDMLVKELADEHLAWVKDASDPEKGLVELPLKAAPLGPSAVSAGGPLAYGEASPYRWVDLQAQALAQGSR